MKGLAFFFSEARFQRMVKDGMEVCVGVERCGFAPGTKAFNQHTAAVRCVVG